MKRIVSFLIGVIICLQGSLLLSAPLAKNGILDLSEAELNKGELVKLDGEWEFYWNKLYTPETFRTSGVEPAPLYFAIPACWNEGYLIDGQELDGVGYATFRLRIRGLSENKLAAFQVPLMNTSYRLWANGNLISTNGVVGASKVEVIPQYLPKTVVTDVADNEIELVLQISNFHHYNGGIWQSIKIGYVDDVLNDSRMKTAFDLFTIGAILIMALYHFGLYALRRKEVSPLFFGLFCLVVAFRISIIGSGIFAELFPGFSWELMIKLNYFTLFFGLAYYCAFIQSLYPLEFSRKVLNFIVVITVGYVLFTVLTPATVFPAYLTYYQLLMVASSVYTMYALVLAIIRGREGAGGILGGCAIIIITLVNDILYNQEIIYTGEFVGIGLLCMIFFQSYVLSSKFSKAFDMVEELSIHLDHLVKERTAAIKDLLDNTGQGFFSFTEDFTIQEYTSKATVDFFGKPIESINALDLMFPGSQKEMKEIFNIVFDQNGNLDLVEEILPAEMKQDGSTFQIDYHWIEARENSPGRIMIVMTDITIERKLELKLKADETRNQMIVKIAVDRSGFVDFINEVNRCLECVEELLDESDSDFKANELFRYYHTIKGGMASYFFEDVANKAHKIENLLDSIRTTGSAPTDDILQTIKTETSTLKEMLESSLKELDDIIPKQLIKAGIQSYYTVSEQKMTALEQALDSQVRQDPVLADVVRSLRRQPIRNIMKKLASDAENLTVKLGKKVKIQLEGEETEIVHDTFKSIFASLIHLVRNCVDHGIEDPDTRASLDKPEEGNLLIKTKADKEQLMIQISDDGAGIDPEKVKNKALEKGLIDKTKISEMSRDDIVKLIFHPGFSTNEVVTDLSGRGVGMDAVAKEVLESGGSINIQTDPGNGTQFLIKVPLNPESIKLATGAV
ncbi:MAG: ATP-binding protein [Proteobacteria bacterium]|nr:ATP-binding protein [Pseudomonadota bacterium]